MSFKNCTMRTKMSTLTLGIPRSKLIVQVIHELKIEDRNLSLILSTTLSKKSSLNWCLHGKLRWRFYLKTNLQKSASTIDNSTSLLNQQLKILFKLFLVRIIFVISNIIAKKCKNIAKGWPNLFVLTSIYFMLISFLFNLLLPKLMMIVFQMFLNRGNAICEMIIYHTPFLPSNWSNWVTKKQISIVPLPLGLNLNLPKWGKGRRVNRHIKCPISGILFVLLSKNLDSLPTISMRL